MGCKFTRLGPDSYVVACSRGRQVKRCKNCGRPLTKLCDYPLRGEKKGQTCDAPLCNACAVSQGENVDYCPPHARLVEKEEQDSRRRWRKRGRVKE